MPRLCAGCIDVAAAAEAARTLLKRAEAEETFDVQIDTPLGRIVLADGRDHTYGGDVRYLAILELGGDDQYEGAAGADYTHPVAIDVMAEF